MLKKGILLLTPKYTHLKNHGVFLLLSAIAFFVRFPFFFRDYIDRDESTFILMGQSWVDGFLPYTQLWDLKPPITYLFFAMLISIFGKSFIAIRIAGTLLVIITAFFTYKITLTVYNSKKIGLWAAIGTVALLSMFGSLQGVMSEHICMAFFMPGLYFYITAQKGYTYVIAGILFGLALMVKINMAYAVLFLGVYLLYTAFRQGLFLKGITNSLGFGFGVIGVIIATLIPYYLEDQSLLWWNSVVLAPIEYTGARRYSLLKMAPICIITLGFLWWSWKKNILDFKQKQIQILSLVIIGVVFSFVQGGRVNGHYLVQLHPVSLVFIAIAISKIRIPKRINYAPYALLLMLLLPTEAYIEYVSIVKNKWVKNSFFNGEGITVPAYLLESRQDPADTMFFEYRIGNWLLDTQPPTKAATHPSNICRDEAFKFYENPRATSMEELRYIMEELQPKTVVTRANRLVFDKDEIEENHYINAYLETHYQRLKTIDKAAIYMRL